MARRWAASAFLDADKRFRRIMGYRDLWMLRSVLDERGDDVEQERLDTKGEAA